MPSSRPRLREPESEATARASEQVIYEEIWRQSLEVRRAEHEAAAVVRQLQNSMKKSQVMRMANYHWLIAFDNAFREGAASVCRCSCQAAAWACCNPTNDASLRRCTAS